MRNPLARLLLVFALVAPAASCALTHASLAPDEVVIAVDTRSRAWSELERAFPFVSNEELSAELRTDSTSWGLLEANAGPIAPSQYTAVVQSQKIATEIAAMKVQAGEYTDEDKLELIQALRKAWDSLEGYFNTPNTPALP